jgi:hypothetical protein
MRLNTFSSGYGREIESFPYEGAVLLIYSSCGELSVVI